MTIPEPTEPMNLALPSETTAQIRVALPQVATAVVTAIVAEVPSYESALTDSMGETIRDAVQLALGGFLSLATDSDESDPRTPTAPAVRGAYQLGRGEARSGRTTDALLSAFRIGARVSWREMAAIGVDAGLPAARVASFAELVFAYIDELSAASVAGHADELATSGRVRERLLERIAQPLLDRAPAEAVLAAAERADWAPPTTLTAVIVPESQVRPVLGEVSAAALVLPDPTELEGAAVVLVPDAHGRARATLLHRLRHRDCLVGPPQPWLDVHNSFDRALRARALGLTTDTEQHLARLVLSADPMALADLRVRVLAPLADLKPASAEKLTETLRAWLLHQGRREDVAEALFVHPQTVRYRMGQLRELFGDRLENPEAVLELTVALALAHDTRRPDPGPRDQGLAGGAE